MIYFSLWSSQLMVCIATTNTIGIINVSCSISIIICINFHLNVRFSTLRRTFILCLSTKQQHKFSLNNFQYYLIKLSLLILLQISLQLNDGSSQLTVCIATTNTIGIINTILYAASHFHHFVYQQNNNTISS